MEQDGSFVEAIEKVAREAEEGKLREKYEVREIHGQSYVREDLKLVREPDPAPAILHLSTLQSLVDYVRDDPDAAFTEDRTKFVIVQSPTGVSFGTGASEPYLQRHFIAQALAPAPSIPYGSQMAIETFLVMLRTLFVETDNVKAIVDLLSSIDATNSIRVSDDGLSQAVTVSKGVRGKADAKVPNPVVLQPYRTFAEVIQPASPFLLRLHARQPLEMPFVSLTEADMGQWRLAAVANVKAFLVDALPGVAVYG